MFGVYLVEGYVVSSTLDGPGSRTPSEILSDYFGRAVYLVMKGPRPRECPPTQAFPKLQETAKFQDGYPFLVASEESLEEVRRVVSAFAQDESPEAKIGGIDRERWRDGGVEIERCVASFARAGDSGELICAGTGSGLISCSKAQEYRSPRTCGGASASTLQNQNQWTRLPTRRAHSLSYPNARAAWSVPSHVP